MPIENDFLPFATSSEANVLSESDYTSLPALSTGFVAGVANSAQVNTVLRKSSIMAAMLAQFIVDNSGQPAIDDGTTATLEANLKKAIQSIITSYGYAALASPAFSGTPTAPTAASTDNSAALANTSFVQGLIAALKSYVQTTFGTQTWVNANFAPLASPALTGTPTAPTPANGDNSTKLATTAFVSAVENWIMSTVAATYATQADVHTNFAPNHGAVMYGSTFHADSANGQLVTVDYPTGAAGGWEVTNVGWVQSWVPSYVSAVFNGRSLGASRSSGYQVFPGGMIIQWGWLNSIPGNGSVYSFPIKFPNAVFTIVSNDDHNGGGDSARVTSCSIVSTSQFEAWGFDPPTGTTRQTNLQWIALGW